MLTRLGRRIMLVILAPVVFVIGFVFIVMLAVVVGGWNASVFAYCWMRWKLLGIPIPPKHAHPG